MIIIKISEYNRNDARNIIWNNGSVLKHHRTISELLNDLIETEFKIAKIEEPLPTKETIEKVPKYIYQYDRPYFIFIKAYK